MTKLQIFYEGNLHTKIVDSNQSVLFTDAPLDHEGEGKCFSPTDLLAASLGSCIATVMGIFAKKRNLDFPPFHLEVEKEMSKSPRRVGHLKVELFMKKSYSLEIKQALEKIAHSCPVQLSLHPDVAIEILIHWP